MFRLISDAVRALFSRRLGHDYDEPAMVRFYDLRGNLLSEATAADAPIRFYMADGYRELTPEGMWMWHNLPAKP